MNWLESANFSYEELIETAALFKSLFEETQAHYLELCDDTNKSAFRVNELRKELIEFVPKVFEDGVCHQKVTLAKKGADAAHREHRNRQEEIRKIWASGKYSSRDICAEKECADLSMSFSTARKALRNTPDPA
ncbi:MAG: hypothetical protein PHY54_01585 [Methylococcales bacterium]|nr:hypothetical protein [Methylococcales bacterium]